MIGWTEKSRNAPRKIVLAKMMLDSRLVPILEEQTLDAIFFVGLFGRPLIVVILKYRNWIEVFVGNLDHEYSIINNEANRFPRLLLLASGPVPYLD